MKNFYDATVIRPALTINVQLKLTPIGNMPCRVKINQETHYDSVLDQVKTIDLKFPLMSPINIEISIIRQHPQAVQVKLEIDGYEILPIYQYLADPPTSYIDTNAPWKISIPNFYSWHHEVTGQGWIV